MKITLLGLFLVDSLFVIFLVTPWYYLIKKNMPFENATKDKFLQRLEEHLFDIHDKYFSQKISIRVYFFLFICQDLIDPISKSLKGTVIYFWYDLFRQNREYEDFKFFYFILFYFILFYFFIYI